MTGADGSSDESTDSTSRANDGSQVDPQSASPDPAQPNTYHRDTFDVTYEEARRVVDYQLDSISDIDSKAAHTLRVLFVLFGLLITAISVVVKAVLQQQGTDIDTARQFINAFTTGGVVLLLLSLLVAIWTYNETNTRSGLSPYEVLRLAEDEPREKRFERLFGRFPNWILYNEAAIRKDSTLLFLSHSSLFVSVVLFTVGVLAELPFNASKHVLRVPIPMSLEAWFFFAGSLLFALGLLERFSEEISEFLDLCVEQLDREDVLVLCGVALLLLAGVLALADRLGIPL